MVPQPGGKCQHCKAEYDTEKDFVPNKSPVVEEPIYDVETKVELKVVPDVEGDVNGDGKVDEEDLSIVHKAYSSKKTGKKSVK